MYAHLPAISIHGHLLQEVESFGNHTSAAITQFPGLIGSCEHQFSQLCRGRESRKEVDQVFFSVPVANEPHLLQLDKGFEVEVLSPSAWQRLSQRELFQGCFLLVDGLQKSVHLVGGQCVAIQIKLHQPFDGRDQKTFWHLSNVGSKMELL